MEEALMTPRHSHGGAEHHRHGHDAHHDQHAEHHHRAPDEALRLKDPVCGMMVDPHATPHRATHDGQTFYFCGAGCRRKFEAGPSRYLSPAQAKSTDEPPPEGAVYICPMHPEVRQAALGVSDLRHGAGAGDRDGRRGSEPRARRYRKLQSSA